MSLVRKPALELLVGLRVGIARGARRCPQRHILNASAHVLTAGAYGRGIWQIPLGCAIQPPTVTANPNSLTFASQVYGTEQSANRHTEEHRNRRTQSE